jgi:hypothetical protein
MKEAVRIRHSEVAKSDAIVIVQGTRSSNTDVNDGFTGPVPGGCFARYLGHRMNADNNPDEFAICNRELATVQVESFSGKFGTEARRIAKGDARARLLTIYAGCYEHDVRSYQDRITILAWNPRFTASPAGGTSQLTQ